MVDRDSGRDKCAGHIVVFHKCHIVGANFVVRTVDIIISSTGIPSAPGLNFAARSVTFVISPLGIAEAAAKAAASTAGCPWDRTYARCPVSNPITHHDQKQNDY